MNIAGIGGYNWSSQYSLKTDTRQNVPGTGISGDIGISSGTEIKGSATDEFKAYMQKTPAQRWQESWLAQRGITPEEFESMSADEKQKLLAEMKAELETKMKEDMKRKAAATGANTDLMV